MNDRYPEVNTMAKIRDIHSKKRPAPLTWTPVTGEDGRVRFEMRWHVGTPAKKRSSAAA